jgi:hypothetical protein|tara:strand:+ start:826 stop:1005 length:180 start_codon:yes stop_codon:yes gene_type:complete
MKKRGYLREKEIAFLKSGVIFNVLKLVMFGMRPDNLLERKQLIREGKYHLVHKTKLGGS